MENILNEPEKLIQIIENANKKFFTSLLGKNSALYYAAFENVFTGRKFYMSFCT